MEPMTISLITFAFVFHGCEADAARITLHELVAGLTEQIQSVRDVPRETSSSELKVGAADFYQIVRKHPLVMMSQERLRPSYCESAWKSPKSVHRQ
jgi:hypothetical protein